MADAPERERRALRCSTRPLAGVEGAALVSALLFFWGVTMARRATSSAKSFEKTNCQLPIPVKHWREVVRTVGFSTQHARIVELVLRGFTDKEIADEMQLGLGTIKDYMGRIGRHTQTNGRVQLIVHLFAASYDLLAKDRKAKPLKRKR